MQIYKTINVNHEKILKNEQNTITELKFIKLMARKTLK